MTDVLMRLASALADRYDIERELGQGVVRANPVAAGCGAMTWNLTLIVLVISAAPLAAQNIDTALVRSIDSAFAWANTTSPGCAVGVDGAGAPLVRRAYGMANLETGTVWSVGTISESGSVAKQFTAAALVILARDGVLSLDDDITRWIPEVRAIGRRITIRHLLTHTSGLPDRYALHQAEGRPAGEVDHPNAEVLDIVSRLRELNFDPGEDYLYSNTGYVVAATIVARASGQSLQAFTQARIFGPLGMTSTRWRVDHRTVVPGRASAYAGTSATGYRNDHPFTRVVGSGGLLITVDDFLRWEAALQSGAGAWGAVRDSLERAGRLNDGTELNYALGVGVGRWRGVPRVSHTGSTGGYRAALYRFPDQQVSVALLCNAGVADPSALATRVAVRVLGSALAEPDAEPAGVAVDSAVLAALAGAYHAPRTEEVLILAIRGGQLTDSLAGNQALIPLAPDRFKYRGGQRTIRVVRAAGGAPVRLVMEASNARPVEYVQVARPRFDAAALAAYAGEYVSLELGARARFLVRGDTLMLDLGWRSSTPFLPLYRDGFGNDDVGLARFLRDPRGRITGLVVWSGRVRHLRFERVATR
ncbi:MAG: serine hydrolase domain-containing protein [Gemmatimonadales bacterium]|nr:serine hydrolase domain-containing protein [Gemmatimonadales bacterium]